MAKIIDTHCHLSSRDFDEEDVLKITKQANELGIKYLFDVGYNIANIKRLLITIMQNPNVYGLIGIHPQDANEINATSLAFIKEQVELNSKIIGIGEIGLDYYNSNVNRQIQINAFRAQVAIAKELNVPISVHLRDQKNKNDAYEDCYNILKEQKTTKAIMHCFCGSFEYALKFIKLGFYISISGIVTFKNGENIVELVNKIDLENLVIETDSPFLAPNPYRGKKNTPLLIKYVIKKIALIKKLNENEVINQTFYNVMKLFPELKSKKN